MVWLSLLNWAHRKCALITTSRSYLKDILLFVSVYWLACCLCLKRKAMFLIAACQPSFPNCLQFFCFLELCFSESVQHFLSLPACDDPTSACHSTAVRSQAVALRCTWTVRQSDIAVLPGFTLSLWEAITPLEGWRIETCRKLGQSSEL